MKRYICINLLIALVLAISSCEVEEVGEWHPEKNFKHVVPDQYGLILLNYSYSKQTSTSTSTIYRFFSMNLEMSIFNEDAENYWNFKIDKVDYYLDGNLLETSTDAPFKISYSNNDISIGTHTIKAILHFSGEGFENIKAERIRKFEIKDR